MSETEAEAIIRAMAKRAHHVHWMRAWPNKPTWRDRIHRWLYPELYRFDKSAAPPRPWVNRPAGAFKRTGWRPGGRDHTHARAQLRPTHREQVYPDRQGEWTRPAASGGHSGAALYACTELDDLTRTTAEWSAAAAAAEPLALLAHDRSGDGAPEGRDRAQRRRTRERRNRAPCGHGDRPSH